MTVAIRKLHPHFFGEVSGVDLRKPLTPQEAADIEAGMDKYAVLLFRNQDITDEQQLAFSLNFGEREKARGGTITKKEDYRLTSGLNDVSNLGKDGKPLPKDHRTHLFNLTEHATQPEFVYVHKWTLHDLVMWDNRQTMHRVRRYDQSQPRDMRRATVAGTEPTVQQQAAE